jgi:hypothetical protein
LGSANSPRRVAKMIKSFARLMNYDQWLWEVHTVTAKSTNIHFYKAMVLPCHVIWAQSLKGCHGIKDSLLTTLSARRQLNLITWTSRLPHQ